MLKIRLARIGKKSQPSYRIIVQEHRFSPKRGKFVEVVGHYHPATPDKEMVIKRDRIEHWISVGAQPSDTVASLLKRKEGFKDMDRYIAARIKKGKKKKEVEEAPAEEKAEEPAKEEAKTEEAPVEEAAAPTDEEKEEEPTKEETPEAPAEEAAAEPAAEPEKAEEAAPAEEAAAEDAPAA